MPGILFIPGIPDIGGMAGAGFFEARFVAAGRRGAWGTAFVARLDRVAPRAGVRAVCGDVAFVPDMPLIPGIAVIPALLSIVPMRIVPIWFRDPIALAADESMARRRIAVSAITRCRMIGSVIMRA